VNRKSRDLHHAQGPRHKDICLCVRRLETSNAHAIPKLHYACKWLQGTKYVHHYTSIDNACFRYHFIPEDGVHSWGNLPPGTGLWLTASRDKILRSRQAMYSYIQYPVSYVNGVGNRELHGELSIPICAFAVSSACCTSSEIAASVIWYSIVDYDRARIILGPRERAIHAQQAVGKQ
jgi:hypothetical protein